MNKLVTNLFLLFVLIITHLGVKAADTLHVVTHHRETVVTDPSTGNKTFTRWGVFPLAADEVRKIMLKVSFACPDSMRCADWDYSDRISIRRKGGIKGEDLDYEIARMLTPYGGAFSKDWKFQWEVDVTDFAILLRDSVEIEYKHSGYEPNTDRGWAVTLDFEFIKGSPARMPLTISKIYDAHYPYGSPAKPIDEALTPVEVRAVKGAETMRLRVLQTGHGMDKPDGCGEFCSKFREVLFDGRVVDKRFLWKECSDNPLYPQAGTWLIDRANWCPGYLVQPDCFDFKVRKNSRHNIQFKMQNYQAAEAGAEEFISAYLIQYAPATRKKDIAIEDVIVPSSKDIHSRINTGSLFPRVIISNKGSERSNILNFTYNFGAENYTYRYDKVLAPLSVDTVTLPQSIPALASEFGISVVEQGVRDSYPEDNHFKTSFRAMPGLDGELTFTLSTNKEAAQTSYLLRDAKGKVYLERGQGSLRPQTTYQERLNLPEGVYQLLLEDAGHDGLEFWFNGEGGAGYANLKNAGGKLLKVFQPDFGKSISYVFAVDGRRHEVENDLSSFSLFPTRTNDFTNLQFETNAEGDVRVDLVADPGGSVVESFLYKNTKSASIRYDLSKYPKGRFYMKVYVNGKMMYSKRVRLKE